MGVRRKAAGAALWAAVLLGAAAAARGQEEYIIGGGDVLQVNVWKNAELTQTVTVRPDGRITLPLIRDVDAAGLTPLQLGETVAQRLSAFVNAPNVTITVSAASGFRVYTQGAVTAGMHVLAAPTTARQLLSRAGGPGAGADLARAYLLRGAAEVPVDLTPVARGAGGGARDVPLAAGDILVVPFRDVVSGRVLVVGEVASPQAVAYEPGMTLLDAYLRAGGGTPAADLQRVQIRRTPARGEASAVTVNLERVIRQGALGENVPLSPGDIAVVPFRPPVERVLVAGEVRTPKALPYREGLTVLDAFVDAGAGTEYADLDSVKVVRRGADGRREEIEVDLDRVLKRAELARNVPLLPGDVVVVPR